MSWLMLFGSTPVHAGELTYMRDILSRTQISVNSDHTITFKLPSAISTGQAINIYFLTGASGQSANFSLANLSSTRDVDITSGTLSGASVNQCDSATASYPAANVATTTNASTGTGTAWGFQSSTDNLAHKLTLTPPSATFNGFAAGNCVRIRLGSVAAGSPTAGTASTTAANPANATTSTSQYLIKITTPSDSGLMAAGIVAGDQPTANATTLPSMTFEVGVVTSECTNATTAASMTTSSLAFRDLSAQYVQSTSNYLCTRLTTNALNGAMVQVKSQYGLMTSSQAKTFPATAVTSAPSTVTTINITTTYNLDTEAYGICETSNGAGDSLTPAEGATSISSEYDGTCAAAANQALNGSQAFGKLSTAFDTLWSTTRGTSLAYANFVLKAAVSVSTPPGNDYRDTLTLIAFATF